MLKEVKLPEAITIGNNAFKLCKMLNKDELLKATINRGIRVLSL